MANKLLKKVKKILLSSPLSVLNAKELKEYYNYRIKNLVMARRMLVRREMEYLLCETGKGSLRFDPELLNALDSRGFLMEERIAKILEESKNNKLIIQTNVLKSINSPKINNCFVEILKQYIENLKIVGGSPLLIHGEIKNIPLSILIKNGEWILPDDNLMEFLKQSKAAKRLPIIIAKKIHGILFPFFKGVSVLGFNLYSTLLDIKIINMINKFENKSTLPDRYNERIEDIEELANEIQNDYYEGNQLKNFLENLLPENAGGYFDNFNKHKITFNNFKNSIKQIKGAKAKNGILKWLEHRQKIFRTLLIENKQ